MNPKLDRVLFVLALATVCLAEPLVCGSAFAGENCCVFPWNNVKNTDVGNGIVVDAPKVFDDLSLISMADQLSATLSQISGLNGSQVTQNIGTLQGGTQSSVSRAFSISTLPLPSLQTTSQLNTNLNQLQLQQVVTSNGAFAPTAPAVPLQTLPDITQGGYAVSSQDILSEQMDLSYQILNLRLLLERSMSDRIYRKTGDHRQGQRAQALLGFQISIDPLKQHEHEAAVVQIELVGPTIGEAPTLVSLMPQAKTYNVAALSQKASAFGASAVVKVVTLGYNEQHQAQSYFLYRDTDTVAFERHSQPDKLTFGWEFRPVLKRPAVEAGLRQMFAVISLNELDDSDNKTDYPIQAKIKTYWTKFDQDKAVITSGPCDSHEEAVVNPILVPCSYTVQNSLGPKVEGVELSLVGQSNILINVQGNNFYAGTEVALGDKIVSDTDPGLIIKSDHLLQIYANAVDLTKGKAVIIGRYGLSSEIADIFSPLPDEIKLQTSYNLATLADVNPLELNIRKKENSGTPPDLKHRLLIATIGSQSFVVEPRSWRVNSNALTTTLFVSRENLSSNAVVSAMFPLTPLRRPSITIETPPSADSVILLYGEDPQTWGIVGRNFDAELIGHSAVFAGKQYSVSATNLQLVSKNLLTIQVPTNHIAQISNVVVQLGALPAVVLPAPKSVQVIKASLLTGPSSPVPVGSSPSIDFSGTHFDLVTNVSYGNTNLVYFADPNGEKLHVFLTHEVTDKPGPVSLPVRTKDGSTLIANFSVQ